MWWGWLPRSLHSFPLSQEPALDQRGLMHHTLLARRRPLLYRSPEPIGIPMRLLLRSSSGLREHYR